MLGLDFDLPDDRPLRVLAIGAHSDDIEIGAGGTIMRLCSEHPSMEVRWVVLSAIGDRAFEARSSADRLLAGVGSTSIEVEAFRERYFPLLPGLKEWFDHAGSADVPPDLVIGPRSDDLHQDHRTTAELIRQTYRDQLVLEYEIPKLEGDLGQPNLYVELPRSVVEAKITHLETAFGSQRSRTWFREELFRGLMALRGLEGGATSGYAEAFTTRRVRIGPPRK